jgi:cytochrome c-type biogenesis protein CcmF
LIGELGHLALALALMLALAAASLPLYGAQKGDARLVAMAPSLAYGQFFFVLVAFLALMHGFVTSDFTIANVALNSHSAKPLLYKIAGTWGSHEGSLLLWALILTLFGGAVARFGRGLPANFRARVLSVQAMITIGFLLFMLTTSNPFLRLEIAPLDGNGLNPLLQDPGLVFHPPMLYLGYVGFSVAFSFSIAALIEGEVTPQWARWVRPWTLLAWAFLTGGIALGSWWAYYELGWGGWWFWDPVENASFMPWLAGTALLHSATVVEKRDCLKRWTILLAILTFSLSLIGTFLVRSGVLTSVHAFAVDPARGLYILGFLGIVIGGSLALYAVRAERLEPTGYFRPVSREGALVFNNLFLLTVLATVFLGTLYPLLLDALIGQKLSVGPPYYEKTFVPLVIPILAAMVIGPMMHWKRTPFKSLLSKLKLVLVLSVGGAAIALYQSGSGGILAFAGVLMALWVIFGTLRDLFARIFPGNSGLQGAGARLSRLRRSQWGVTLAHLGLGVAVLGMVAAEAWTDERLVTLELGDDVVVGEYRYVFEGVEPIAGENYSAIRSTFRVFRGEAEIALLHPEERTFVNPPMQTTEAAIYTMISGDLYAVIGDQTENGRWSARLYFKPLVAWMWSGALLMMLGAFLSLSDRRFRLAVGARRKKRGHDPAAQLGVKNA